MELLHQEVSYLEAAKAREDYIRTALCQELRTELDRARRCDARGGKVWEGGRGGNGGRGESSVLCPPWTTPLCVHAAIP